MEADTCTCDCRYNLYNVEIDSRLVTVGMSIGLFMITPPPPTHTHLYQKPKDRLT